VHFLVSLVQLSFPKKGAFEPARLSPLARLFFSFLVLLWLSFRKKRATLLRAGLCPCAFQKERSIQGQRITILPTRLGIK